jgi:LPPG:FO 2-phospho-L-lactate transferase
MHNDVSRRPGPIVALAGGVGAARFLRGLDGLVAAHDLTVVVNTGDDREFYGVHVSPDIDIVTYTLAGRIDPERGYGLAGDTHHLLDALSAFGHETWFRLGDRDFANCLHRTLRLRDGVGLAEITDELRRAHGVESEILPMSEDPCPTIVQLEGDRRVHFEEYLARDGAPDEVCGVDLDAARRARPAPALLDRLRAAGTVLFCPSNPVVSIGPILAVPGVRDAIADSGAAVVGVSPIVGGAPVKGPADRLLRGIGVEVSARGVAGLYRGLVHGFVIDERDAAQCADIEALGIRAVAVDTIMRNRQRAVRVARAALELATRVG